MWRALILCLSTWGCVLSTHFRGAIIQWRPVNPQNFDGRIEITHRIAWRRTWDDSTMCQTSDIGTNRLFGFGSLSCSSGCSGSFSLQFYCTDFSYSEDWVSGSKSTIYTVGTSVTSFEASYTDCCWISLVGGSGNWEVRVRGTLTRRSDNNRINTSPVTTITPIVRLRRGCSHRIVIPNQDADQDTVRCRWAQSSRRECADVCNALSGAVLDQNACTLSYTATTSGWYVVSLQMEDFMSPTSTTPLSSVPIQFLVNVFSDSIPCNSATRPELVPGETPADGSCIPVPAGGTYRAGLVAYSGGSGVSITNFVTSSPVGLTRSAVVQSSYNSTVYYVNVTWTPRSNQIGTLQVFCFHARSSTSQNTNQSCIYLIGGVAGPGALQSSLHPNETVLLSARIVWSITFDQAITRPNSDRYIRFYEQSTRQLVYSVNTRTTAATFPLSGSNGRTMTFSFSFNFMSGRRYYVLLDSGVASGTLFCLQESVQITSSTFWTFLVDCPSGYVVNGSSCVDVDECSSGSYSCPISNAVCQNTLGSYMCVCNPGYELQKNMCQDIDECSRGTDSCSPVAQCINTVGSYSCTCLAGTTGDGFTCTDACDECLGIPANCGTHNCNTTTSDCTNTVGSFQCTCIFGLDSDGVTCSLPPRPDPPRLVTVELTTTTTFSVTWLAPTASTANRISSYILMLIDELTGSAINVTTILTTYTFSGLHEYRNYSCLVYSMSRYGPISLSTITVRTTTLETVPSSPPQNFNGAISTSTSAVITWNPPPVDDQNGAIIRYVINVTVVGTGATFQLMSTTTSLTVFTLDPYTTYVCIIAAVSSVGIGPFSNRFTLSTPEDAPSSPPQSVGLSPVSSTSLSLSWTAPARSDRNGVIREYRINITEVITGRVIYLTSSSTSIVAIGLHPYYYYSCVITAVTVAAGPYSQTVQIRTPEDVPSGSPRNFIATAASSRSASISWNPPHLDEQNGVIVNYLINVTVVGSGQTFQLSSTTTSLTVSTLLPYRTYLCIIAAVTSAGVGPYSVQFMLTTPQDVPTTAPQTPSSVIRTSRAIYCTWSPPPQEHQNGIIIEYRINVTEILTGRIFVRVTTNTFLEVTSLHPDYEYEWVVTAVTIGVGPYTTVVNIRTPEDVPSSAPTSFSATVLSARSVEASWQAPPSEDRNGVIIAYIINVTSLQTGLTQQMNSTTTSVTATNLAPFTTYICIIAASTAVGLGPFSTTITFRTLESAPEGNPSNFTGMSLNSTHIFLIWSPPPSDQVNGIIRGYHLNITEAATGQVYQHVINNTQMTIGSLHPFYTYYCEVAAFTVQTGLLNTSFFTVKTAEDVPAGPPTSFSASSADSRTITLLWSPPAADVQNGIIRHYLVTLSSALPTLRQNVSLSTLSVNVTNLRPNTVYLCTVRAVTIGTGPPTSVQYITTREDAPSSPPGNISLSPNNSRSIIVTWNHPLPAEINGIIIDYSINITSTTSSSSFLIGSNATQYVIGSLKPYVSYSCIIAAHTSVGQGPFSNSISLTTPEDSPRAPPMMLLQSNLQSRSVEIYWKAPTVAMQNGVIRYYNIEAYESNTGNNLTYQTPSSQERFTLNNLHPYYSYAIRVSAVTVGPGPLSSPINVNTLQDKPTAAPWNPSGMSLTSTLIRLDWSPPPPEHINGIIVFYLVKVEEVITNRTWTFHAVQTHINIGPLHPYYSYRCRVAANTIAIGPFTPFFFVNSGETLPTGAPLRLSASRITSTSLSLSWDPPLYDQQNGNIRYYVVTLTDVALGSSRTLNVIATSFTISDLRPFFVYNVSVAAHTTNLGPQSGQLTIQLPPAPPSVAPSNLSGFAIDRASIILRWVAPPSNTLNGILALYVVRVTERETGLVFEYNTTNTSIMLTSLHPDYIYECNVAAYTNDVGPFSRIFTVQALISAPSGPPLNITTTALTATSISVEWEAPLPQFRNGPILAYSLTVTDTISNSVVYSSTLPMTVTEISGLQPFTPYNFTISARTSVGFGPSDTQTEMTLGELPSSPTSLSASAVSGDPYSLYISWMEPLKPNGVISSYNVYCQESNTSSSVGIIGESIDIFGESIDIFGESIDIFGEVVPGTSFNATVGGLTPFTEYGCFVSANTSFGEGNNSFVTYQTTDEDIPQGPPVNIQASVISSTTLFLSYSSPLVPYGYITSYLILVVETNVLGSNGSVLRANSSGSFTVSDLKPNTYYNISVAASTRIGRGPYDTTIIRTFQDRPSGSPQSLSTLVTGTTTANVSWSPPDISTQNGPIISYTVVITDLSFGMADQGLNSTVLHQFISGLEEYGNYSVRVAASTVEGLGPYSAPVTFITLEDIPTAPPQNISGQALSSTLIMLLWSPPPPLDANGIVRHYTVIAVERYTGRQWTFFAVDPDLHVGSLHPYYYYDFNISATTIGPGPFSSVFTLLTEPEPPVAAPEQLAVSKTSTSFNVTWNPPPFEDINGPIQYYTVHVTEVDTGVQFFPTSTSATQITFTELHPYYIYHFTVAAYTVGIGPYTTPIIIQLEPEAPTSPPAGLSGFSLGSDSVFLSWDAPLLSERNGMILYYLVNVTEQETGSTFGHVSLRTNFTLFGLHPYYNYQITTTAVTVGQGPSTSPVVITTDQDAPSGPVVNLNATVMSHEEVLIQWQEPASERQNGIITSYIIRLTSTETGMAIQYFTNRTLFSIPLLKPFTTYTYEVAAMTVAGIGPFSNPIIFLTDQTEPYGAPEVVNVTVVSSSSIKLVWNPPPIDTTNGIITEYRINITELDTGTEMTFVSYTTSSTVQGLHPNYIYECSISAVTTAEGPYSSLFVIQMPEDVPSGFPQIFRGEETSSQSISFSWDSVILEEQNGVITSYTLVVSEASSGQVQVSRSLPSSETSLTIDSLLPFTNYLCTIAASTSVGIGPSSQTITVTTLQDNPELPPTNLSSMVLDSSTVILSWSTPDGRLNGIIQEYRINLTEIETGRMFQEVSIISSATISSLHPDYTYSWAITAFTISEGPYSSHLNFATPEDVPSGPPISLIATPVSPTSFILNWEKPLENERNGDIVGYAINITNLDTEQRQQISVGLISNYTFSNLKPFTIYESTISARTSVGLGPYSSSVYVTTLEDAPGTHPLNSSGVAINSTHIYLNWSPPDPNTVNGVIREYRVNVTEGETGSLLQFIIPSNQTEATIGPLHPFYTYHCTILAYTVEGGPNTSVISIRTNEAAPSAPPTNVSVVATSSRSISLMWGPPPRSGQNGILRHYFIVVMSQRGDTVTRNVSSNQQSVSISGLSPFTRYNCTVQAGTLASGPASDVVTVYSPQDVPTGSPQTISVLVLNASSLALSWIAPLTRHRNGLIVRYKIRLDELETKNSREYNSTSYNITINNLHPHYHYTYSVAAKTLVGEGPFSVVRTIQMPQAAPVSGPVDVQVSGVTSTEFTVTWSAPPSEDHNGIIQQYLVLLTEESTGRQLMFYSTTTSLLVESQVLPYNNYTIIVAAVTVNSGPFSSPITITTLEDAPSGYPQNLQANAISSTEVLASWDVPRPVDANGIIVNYTLLLFYSGNVSNVTTSQSYWNANGLQPFTMYTFSVSASTRIGMGPFSSNVSITTPEAAPGGAPINVASSSVTSNSLVLTWEPPPNSVQNGIVRHYIVKLLELNTGSNLNFTVLQRTSLSLGDLHPYYTYQFNVIAVTIDPGPSSLAHRVTTLQDIPVASPLGISETPLSPNVLQISWSPPSMESQNGIITGYFINVSATEIADRLQFMAPGDITSLNVSSLHADYTYHYVIAAATVEGMGPFSSSRSIQMPEDAPTGSPPNQHGSAINSTAIIFTWDHPAVDARNGLITGYSLILLEQATNLSTSYSQTGGRIELIVSNLHPYYDYECRIAAETRMGRGPYGPTFITRTLQAEPSGPPMNVTATVVDSRTILVTWEPPQANVQNGIIQNYTVAVLEQQTSSSFTLVSTVAAITVSDLHPSYDYTVKVAAVTVGTGPFSDMVTTTTLEDAPTGPPLRVVAASVSSTSVRISWQAPVLDLQNGAITSYHITVVERETGHVSNFVTVATDSIYIVNNLHPFYYYNCSVSAYTNALGPSSSYVVQTLPEEPSHSPSNVSAIARNATTVLISWVPPPPEERNGIVQGYSVQVVGVNTEEELSFNINATEIIFGSLHPFYSYRVTVATVTIAHGPFSNPLTFKMPPFAPTTSVQNVTVVPISSTAILVSWLPPNPNYWNGIISRYTIEYTLLRPANSDSGDDDDDDENQLNFVPMMYIAYSPTRQQPLLNNPDPTVAVSPLLKEHLEIDGLLKHFAYSFSIFYENDAGRSNSSLVVEVETPSAAPSGPPTNVIVSANSESSIIVQWGPPELFERNGAINGYQVHLNYTNRTSKLYTVSGSTYSLQVEGLPKYTELKISVAAKTIIGYGPTSYPVKIRTREDVPGQPKDLKTIRVDESTVELSWVPPNEANGIIIEYRVVYYGHKQGRNEKRAAELVILDGPHVVVVSNDQTSLIIKDLETGLTYTFLISGRTSRGYGSNSTLTTNIDALQATEALQMSGVPATTAIIIVAAVGWALLVIGLVLVVAVYIWRKKKRHYKTKPASLASTQRGVVETNLYEVTGDNDDTYDDIMVVPGASSSQSKTLPTLEFDEDKDDDEFDQMDIAQVEESKSTDEVKKDE